MTSPRTNRFVVLYDGNCRICTAQARMIERFDVASSLEVVDMNTAGARSRFPQIAPADAQRELHVVAPDGTLHRGAEAVREMLLRLPGLRGLGAAMGLPGVLSLARPLYAFVARNRYLFGGQAGRCADETCDVGPPKA